MKLRRELVEELASWNMEHEPLSGMSAEKLSRSYFHLQEKHNREILTGLPHCGGGFYVVVMFMEHALSIRDSGGWIGSLAPGAELEGCGGFRRWSLCGGSGSLETDLEVFKPNVTSCLPLSDSRLLLPCDQLPYTRAAMKDYIFP